MPYVILILDLKLVFAFFEYVPNSSLLLFIPMERKIGVKVGLKGMKFEK